MRIHFAVLVTSTLLLWSPTVFAGGPFTNGVAARAQSMQNAFTAIADDASAVYYNPAGLAQQKTRKAEVSLFSIHPNLRYAPPAATTDDVSSRSAMGFSGFLTAPMNEHLVLGAGLYSPAARETNFSPTGTFGGMEHRSEILRKDLALSVGSDLGPVAVGASAIVSHGTYRASVFNWTESASGYGGGFQFGMLTHGPVKLSFVYRSGVVLDLKGEGNLTGVGGSSFQADHRFPSTVTLGGAFDALGGRGTVAAEIERQFWSKVKSFTRDYEFLPLNAASSTHLETRDSWVARIGGAYRIGATEEIRAGFSWTQAAVATSTTIPAQPDFTIRGYSVGYSLGILHTVLHIGLEHQRMLPRARVQNPFPGTYRMNVTSILLGATREW